MITDYNLRPLLHLERTVAHREIAAKPLPPPGAKPGKSKEEKEAFWAQYRTRDEDHFLPILERSIEEQFKGCRPTPTAPAGMPAFAPTFERKKRKGNPPMLIIGNPGDSLVARGEYFSEVEKYASMLLGAGIQARIDSAGYQNYGVYVPRESERQAQRLLRENPSKRCKPPKIIDPISEACVQPLFAREGNPMKFDMGKMGIVNEPFFVMASSGPLVGHPTNAPPPGGQRVQGTFQTAAEARKFAKDTVLGPNGWGHFANVYDERNLWKIVAALERKAPGRFAHNPSKRNPYAQSDRDFLWFLTNTLIPDLIESGNEMTAESFTDGLDHLDGGKPGAMQYVNWLDSTLIPDLKASGTVETAKDFSRLARMIERKFGRKKNPTDPTGKEFASGFIFWEGEGQDAQNEAYNALRILKENGIRADLEVVPGDPRKFGTWRYRIHVEPPNDHVSRMVYDGILNRIATETVQGKMTGHWSSLTRVPKSKRKSPPLERRYPILGKLVRERKEKEARGENCCNPPGQRGPNPPRFAVIDSASGVIQYTKVATGTGTEAFNKAYERAKDMANKLGRVFFVLLEIHGAKVGQRYAVEMMGPLGATEVRPDSEWGGPPYQGNPAKNPRASCPSCGSRNTGTEQPGEWYCYSCGHQWMKVRQSRKENSGHGLPASIENDPKFQKELRAYRRRHGSGPVEVRVVKVPKGYPKYMSVYGEAPHAVYDAPSHSIKGKRIHHFGKKGKNKPWLVSSAERGPKFLAYVGGQFRAGTDWLYD